MLSNRLLARFIAYIYCILILFSFLPSSFAATNTTQAVDDGSNDDNGAEGLGPTVILLFMFIGLSFGIVVMQILSVVGEGIPYTCIVFFLGLFFSTVSPSDGTFGKSIAVWESIDAELLLFIFLPPLVFGEAMSLNWYHVKGGFCQSLFLAGPGVLAGAIMMAGLTKLLLPTWSWNLALTFGSILSATDPVAVVALLKSAGASPKLTILIVGESLLNDGTAMVLFTVFYNALNGDPLTVSSVLVFFLEAAIGSVALGIAFGLAIVRWLRSANRPLKEVDTQVQITITICGAYLLFFLAQNVFQISGVLACCSAGAMLAWLAPPIILSHETMHNVWGLIEWVLNTMIFLLAGLIIGNRCIKDIKFYDWVYLFVLYFFLMVIRFIVVFASFPLISRIGHKCTVKEAVFMSWAGLRGALGMALALIVEKSTPNNISSDTSRLFFFVGGIAALTLIINATTAKSVLYLLDLLNDDTLEKRLVMAQMKKRLKRRMDKLIEQMTEEFKFTDSDLEEVRMSCTLLNEVSSDNALFRDTSRGSILMDAIAIRKARASEDVEDAVIVDKTRTNSVVSGSGNSGGTGKAISRRLGSFTKGVINVVIGGSSVTDSGVDDGRESFNDGSIKRSISISSILMSKEDRVNNRYEEFNRLMSENNREAIVPELLAYVRAIYLEIVRVKYWQNIEGGKLPRLSYSAQFLLYSIDVGLDKVNDDRGAPDWICLMTELTSTRPIISGLLFVEENLPFCFPNTVSGIVGKLESRWEKRAVYMLTSFIEAHSHAQKKIHAFIGNDSSLEETDIKPEKMAMEIFQSAHSPQGLQQTPEELKVLAESHAAVERAQSMLSSMSPDTVAGIRSKQAARLVLAKEAEMVRNMTEEGLLTSKYAEEFLEEIGRDTHAIERQRNKMYKAQAEANAKKRQSQKPDERMSFYERTSVFLSTNTTDRSSLIASQQPRSSTSVKQPLI